MSFKSYLKTLFFCLTVIFSTTPVIGKEASEIPYFQWDDKKKMLYFSWAHNKEIGELTYFIGFDIEDPNFDSDIELLFKPESFENTPSSFNKDIIGVASLEFSVLADTVSVFIRNKGNRFITTKPTLEYRLIALSKTFSEKEYAMPSLFVTTGVSADYLDEGQMMGDALFGVFQPNSNVYLNPDEMLMSTFKLPKSILSYSIVSFSVSLSDSKKIVFMRVPEAAEAWLIGHVLRGKPFDFLSSESNNEEDEMNRALIDEILEDEAVAETSQISENDLRYMKENYISAVAHKIRKNWRYMGAEDHWGCDVHIIESEVGDVLAVNIQNCTIDDSSRAKSFKDSIERAVYKASPLPIDPYKSLFDAEIMFRFRVMN